MAVPRLMDLRLDHVRQRLLQVALLPTPTTTRPALLPTPPSTSHAYTQPSIPPIHQRTQPTTINSRRSTTITHQSQHPEFTTMVTELNVTLRLLFGYDNWSSSFPERLSTSLDHFVSSIQPPRRSQSCTEKLHSATDQYKRHVQNIVITELATTALIHLRRLHQITADLRDWQLAVDTVKRQLQRSHKHLIPAMTQPTFNDLLTFILDTSSPTDNLLRRFFPNLVQAAVTHNCDLNNTQYIVLSSTTESTQPAVYNNINSTDPSYPAPAAATESSLIEVSLDDSNSQPAAVSDVKDKQQPTTTTSFPPISAANNNSYPPDAATAAGNQPSLIDIILHSPDMEPPVADIESSHIPTSTPTFIIPRSPPLPSSFLRRQLPTTPTASCSVTLLPSTDIPTPPLLQRLRALPSRTSIHTTTTLTRHTNQSIPTATTQSISSPTLPTTIAGNNTSTPINARVVTSPAQPRPNTSFVYSANNINNIRSFPHSHINNWRISPEPPTFTTLVIADSNGKRWLDAPPDWVIYSFSGMKLADVSNIMSKSSTINNYERIIIHCGRNDSFQSVKQNVAAFVSFIHSFTHPHLFVVPSLLDPQMYESGLRLFRQIITEEFDQHAILYDEPELYCRLNIHDTKHYSRTTARLLIQVIVHHLN